MKDLIKILADSIVEEEGVSILNIFYRILILCLGWHHLSRLLSNHKCLFFLGISLEELCECVVLIIREAEMISSVIPLHL